MNTPTLGHQDEPFGERVDPRRYVAVLRRRWLSAALAGGAVLGLVALWTVTAAPSYRSSVDVLVRSSPSSVSAVVEQGNAPELATEVQLVQSPQVLERAEELAGADWAAVTDVDAGQIDETSIIRISVTAGEAESAASGADAVANAYLELKDEEAQARFQAISAGITDQIEATRAQIDELDAQIVATPVDPVTGSSLQQTLLLDQRQTLSTYLFQLEERLEQLQLETALQSDVLQITADARVPGVPSSPNRTQNAVLGVVLASMVAAGTALVRDYVDDHVRSVDDVEEAVPGVPVLATLPRLGSAPDGQVGLVRPTAPAAETYRRLRTNLQFVDLQREVRTILVTSPSEGEGKSTTSANLAATFSLTGQRTVLVDADLRRPSLAQSFLRYRDPDAGLSSVLVGAATLREASYDVTPFGDYPLAIIPAGPIPPNPAELLSGPALEKLLDELAETADTVIVDGPPLLPVTDAQHLAAHVDGVILVARSGRTPRRDITAAVGLLRRSGANLLGIALNGADVRVSTYQYGAPPAGDG